MQSPELSPESNSRLTKMIAATTLAASLAITGCLTNEAEAQATPTLSVANEIPGARSMSGAVNCDVVDAESLHTTKKLLNHPHDFDATIKHFPHQHNTASEMMAKRLVAARRNGLTVYNYQRQYRGLFRDAQYRNAKPVTTYVQQTSRFLEHYGATVTVPSVMPQNSYAEPISALDLNSLSISEQKRVRHAMTEFIDNVGKLPVEFVKNIGLKHVYLVKIGTAAVGGFSDQVAGDAFYIDPRKRIDPQAFSHELTHLWDGKMCGGVEGQFLDRGYDAWNPVNVYNQYPYTPGRLTNRGIYTDHETVANSSKAINLHHKIKKDYANHRPALAWRDMRKYNALFKNVVSIVPYGLTNIAEDKATIGEEILNPYDYQSIYDKDQPILANKFANLLARIYQSNPRIARYFIQVGNNKF